MIVENKKTATTVNGEIEVKVKNKNGQRYGMFNFDGIKGDFPKQAITTTNLNHLTAEEGSRIDYKTKFLELFLRSDLIKLKDKNYFNKQACRLNGLIKKNKDKICLLLPSGAKGKKFDKATNLLLIELQLQAGFGFIKVFFKTNRKAKENLNDYLVAIPKGKLLVPVLDENLKPETFREIYELMLDKTPLMGFFGRDVSKTNIDNKRNYLYIRSRKSDDIIRIVSDITKKTKSGVVKSLVYYWLGYDIFSFTTRTWTYFVEEQDLKIIKNLHYQRLSDNVDLPCKLRDKNKLIETVEEYRKTKRQSIPCSIFSMIQLNTELESISDRMTEEELKELISEEIKILSEGLTQNK